MSVKAKAKRNYRVLRGPEGPRGLPGLSAYGLWLSMGNQGDLDAFFSSLCSQREVLYVHAGGQCVLPSHGVKLQRLAGCLREGRYLAQAMVCASQGLFSVFIDGREAALSRYRAHGVLHGLCVLHIMRDCADIALMNVSDSAVLLDGDDDCIDAFLWCRPVD